MQTDGNVVIGTNGNNDDVLLCDEADRRGSCSHNGDVITMNNMEQDLDLPDGIDDVANLIAASLNEKAPTNTKDESSAAAEGESK